MALQEFTTKIKIPVTPENKSKVTECLEEQFGKISVCEQDDNTLKVSKIKTFWNMFTADATIGVKEKEDCFVINTSLNYKPSLNFWIQVAISAALIVAGGVGVLILAVDGFFFFFGKKKLIESFNETLKKVEEEF